MTVLHRLRAATREAHDRLEATLEVDRWTVDPDRYARLLAGLRSVYGPLERELDGTTFTAVVVPDWAARRKTAWLDGDLGALSAGPLPDAVVPAVVTREDVVGVAYVMEGATLGGAVVARGLPPGLPRRFFTGYGPGRGRMWRAFRERVEGLPGVDEDAAVAAACEAFAAFERPFAGAAP